MPFLEIAQIVGRTPAACRQLAASARAQVRKAPVRTVRRDEHDRVVRAFAAANRSGDLQAGRITNVRMVLNQAKLSLWN